MWRWLMSVVKHKKTAPAATRVPYIKEEPVSTYGCLDDGEERDYPPADSTIKFLRMR